MTDAENILGDGLDVLVDSFATTAAFTVDGSPYTFRGVVSMNQMEVELGPGGLKTNYALAIVARKDQFEEHDVTIRVGQYVTYHGRRWVITNLPYVNDDPVSYHIEADAPQNSK